MDRTSLRTRLAAATAAFVVTLTLAHSVALLAEPTAAGQMARVKATAVLVATAQR
ncbi:MAG: hypothetical protein ABIO71_02235 [Caldimonas sp.]